MLRQLSGNQMTKPNARGNLAAFAVLCSAAACAGHSDEQTAAGGATSSAGTSSAGTSSGAGSSAHGGNGGAAQLPAQAGLSMNVEQPVPSVPQMSCPLIRGYQLGAPNSPTTSDPGESVISGQAASTISCSVTGNGPYAFSGSVHGTTSTGDPISVAFSNGTLGRNDSGTGGVSVYTPQLLAIFTSSSACAIAVLDQQVKPGSIWATFDCPEVASPPSGLCRLQGTVVLENCDGS
jgi:hypothetical protein